jgi:hypothetical protein
MKSKKQVLVGCFLGLFMLSACATQDESHSANPTRTFSAPTLQPSPTVHIFNSEELYLTVTPGGANNFLTGNLPSGQDVPPIVDGISDIFGALNVDVVLEDDTLLRGILFNSPTLARGNGILLLSTTVDSWGSYPQLLQQAGYTVMVLALTRTDFDVIAFDTIVRTFSVASTVNPGNLMVIGELGSADFALRGCSQNLLCDAVVMLSPIDGSLAFDALRVYSPRPLLVVVAGDDNTSYPAALTIIGVTQNNVQFVETTTGRGSGMLALDNTLFTQLLEWLRTNFPSG